MSPIKLTHGLDLFDYLEHNQSLSQCFSDAMTSVDTVAGESFAEEFAWDRFGLIIDVGGSLGAKAEKILSENPRPLAIVVDSASVINREKQHWAQRSDDVSKRI